MDSGKGQSPRIKRTAGPLGWSFLLLCACLCLGWADSWDSIRSAAGKVSAISAEFVQEKHLPILARPLVSTGRIFYRHPDALRWEYTAPLRSVLLMQGGDARRFVQSGDNLVEDDGVRLDAMQFVMPEISAWLGGRFQDNPLFAASLHEGNKIVLRPKDAGLARYIQRIELLPAARPGVIDQVTIFESDDAFTRMVFSNTKVNPSLAPRLFQDLK